jgi:hypothetical protein
MSLGGGGGGKAATIKPAQEYQKILNIFQRQALPAFQQWSTSQPLLNQATGLAQAQAGALPGYASALTSGYQGAQRAVAPLTGMISGAYGGAVPESQLSNLALNTLRSATPTNQLSAMDLGALRSATPTGQLTGPLLATLRNYLTPTLQSQGALTPQLARAATQQALGAEAQAGMANTNAGIAAQLLNRDVYRQQRYNTALQQAMGIGQDVSGLDTAALQRTLGTTQAVSALDTANLQRALAAGQAVEGYNTGALQRAQGTAGSLYGLAQAPFQNALAYAQAQQGLSQGTMSGLYGAEMAPIGAWGSLMNPVGQNISDVIGYNLNARNAANIAGGNKTAGTIGGVGSALGGIAGGVGLAL